MTQPPGEMDARPALVLAAPQDTGGLSGRRLGLALLLLGGKLGDLTGHRRLLVAGLALFGLTSLVAGLAPNAGVLIAARFAQGASAALVAPMALAAVADLFPDGPGRVRAMGIYQGATAAGATAGLVIGGIITQYAGWRAIFLVNPPVIALLVVAVLRLVPGAVLVTASVAALIFGLSQGQQHGFTAPLTVGSLAAAVVLGAGFMVLERRIAVPMLPFRVLADPGRRLALIAMLLLTCTVGSCVYFIALYLQHVLGIPRCEPGSRCCLPRAPSWSCPPS